EHRGGAHQRLAERHHRELEREATSVEHAVAHVVGEDAEVRVAGSQLGPGVADADHRAAVEHVLRHAAVLHPAAIDEAVDVLARDLVREMTPALDAEYATALGLPSLPAIEAMLTMRP